MNGMMRRVIFGGRRTMVLKRAQGTPTSFNRVKKLTALDCRQDVSCLQAAHHMSNELCLTMRASNPILNMRSSGRYLWKKEGQQHSLINRVERRNT